MKKDYKSVTGTVTNTRYSFKIPEERKEYCKQWAEI